MLRHLDALVGNKRRCGCLGPLNPNIVHHVASCAAQEKPELRHVGFSGRMYFNTHDLCFKCGGERL